MQCLGLFTAAYRGVLVSPTPMILLIGRLEDPQLPQGGVGCTSWWMCPLTLLDTEACVVLSSCYWLHLLHLHQHHIWLLFFLHTQRREEMCDVSAPQTHNFT